MSKVVRVSEEPKKRPTPEELRDVRGIRKFVLDCAPRDFDLKKRDRFFRAMAEIALYHRRMKGKLPEPAETLKLPLECFNEVLKRAAGPNVKPVMKSFMTWILRVAHDSVH